MSSAAFPFPAVRVKERAESPAEVLRRAARELLDGGPVCFKISARVKAELLPRWRRGLYVLVSRRAVYPDDPLPTPAPPAPAMQLTVYTSWAGALRECKSPNDQLLVMPLNRAYSRDMLDVAVECRPADPADSWRFEILKSVFEGYGDGATGLDDLRSDAERLIEKCRHV